MEGGRRRRVRDLTTFATFHPEMRLFYIGQNFTLITALWVLPVENAIQDEADDDDTAINTGNETLEWMRIEDERECKECLSLPHCLRYSAKVNLRDV